MPFIDITVLPEQKFDPGNFHYDQNENKIYIYNQLYMWQSVTTERKCTDTFTS